MPGLTDADFGRGLTWASDSTGVPPIADSGPLEVSPELAASIARVLTEGGDGRPALSGRGHRGPGRLPSR